MSQILMVTVFLVFVCSIVWLFASKKPKKDDGDDPYKPRLFLRKRNNGSYFIHERTHKDVDYDLDSGTFYHTFNWETIEAGDTSESATKMMEEIAKTIRRDEENKRSMEYITLQYVDPLKSNVIQDKI